MTISLLKIHEHEEEWQYSNTFSHVHEPENVKSGCHSRRQSASCGSLGSIFDFCSTLESHGYNLYHLIQRQIISMTLLHSSFGLRKGIGNIQWRRHEGSHHLEGHLVRYSISVLNYFLILSCCFDKNDDQCTFAVVQCVYPMKDDDYKISTLIHPSWQYAPPPPASQWTPPSSSWLPSWSRWSRWTGRSSRHCPSPGCHCTRQSVSCGSLGNSCILFQVKKEPLAFIHLIQLVYFSHTIIIFISQWCSVYICCGFVCAVESKVLEKHMSWRDYI